MVSLSPWPFSYENPAGRVRAETTTKTNWLTVFFAALVWWIIPTAVLNQPQNDEPSALFAFACLLGITVALCLCANLRDLGWIVLVWVPLLVWTSLGAFITLGSLAAESGGGPSAAPLAGVAMAIGMAVALILIAAAILCPVSYTHLTLPTILRV